MDVHALLWGLLVMVLIIVATDQLIWRPLIAWSDKFKFEQVESTTRVTSPMLALFQRSSVLTRLPVRAWNSFEEGLYRRLAATRECRVVQPVDDDGKKSGRMLQIGLGVFAALLAIWGVREATTMLHGFSWADTKHLLIGAGATFLRVNASLAIAAAWTIPVGVMIGFNPKLARILQPVVQVVASVPATALFPVLLLGLIRLGGGLGIGSIALMLLGTQWYILFNVIAGAMSIPSDLKEAASLYRFTRWQRWTTLILPGIFPYLITGLVTASGGAWNASIVAEYFHIKDQTLQTIGLGAQISAATDEGKFSTLLLATVLMAMIVVIRRLVWRRLCSSPRRGINSRLISAPCLETSGEIDDPEWDWWGLEWLSVSFTHRLFLLLFQTGWNSQPSLNAIPTMRLSAIRASPLIVLLDETTGRFFIKLVVVADSPMPHIFRDAGCVCSKRPRM